MVLYLSYGRQMLGPPSELLGVLGTWLKICTNFNTSNLLVFSDK
jgi:hypothetical protein